MAYSISTSTNVARINGVKCIRLAITETDVQTNSEGTISDVNIPQFGTIVRYTADSDVSCTPELGRASGWTDDDIDQILSFGSGATYQDSDVNVHYYLSTPGRMYLRSSPGSNGAAINTDLLLIDGWI